VFGIHSDSCRPKAAIAERTKNPASRSRRGSIKDAYLLVLDRDRNPLQLFLLLPLSAPPYTHQAEAPDECHGDHQ
jgi:hypothetical protein